MVDAKVEEMVDKAVFGDSEVIVLGGVKYGVKELTLRKAREWQKKMMIVMGKVQGIGEMMKAEGEEKAAEWLFGKMQDEFIELVFEYSPELMEARAKIEEEATPREFYEAVKVVMNMGNPFFTGLKGLMPQPK